MMAEDTCSTADSEEIKEISNSMAQTLGYLQWPDENPDDKDNWCQIQSPSTCSSN